MTMAVIARFPWGPLASLLGGQGGRAQQAVIAYRAGLTGPRGGPREATVWNLYDWELREQSQ